MSKIVTIGWNTLVETVRQPVFLIILGSAAFMIAFSPSFAMFTLMNDIKLVKDMGLATILLAGLLQSAFSAAGVISSEIEDKTIMLVLTKPVSKLQFVLGKYIGIVAALAASTYLLTMILILTVRIGVPEAVWMRLHRPVIYGELFAFFFALIFAAFSNYFHNRSFTSTCFGYSILMFTFVFILLGFVDKDLKFQRFCVDVDLQVIGASYLVLLALLSITAVSVALSIRFGIILTVGACVSIFILGLLSDHMFGRFIDSNLFAKIPYALLPNMQVFWVADAVAAGQAIPAKYLLTVTQYGVLYQVAVLALSILLFEARELK